MLELEKKYLDILKCLRFKYNIRKSTFVKY